MVGPWSQNSAGSSVEFFPFMTDLTFSRTVLSILKDLLLSARSCVCSGVSNSSGLGAFFFSDLGKTLNLGWLAASRIAIGSEDGINELNPFGCSS